MKIAFLIHDVYETGGTVRTVVNLANELVGRHEIEVASVFRQRESPQFALDSRVRVIPLVDLRPGRERGHVGDSGASRLYPAGEGRYPQYSRLTDLRITGWFDSVDADVVVGTRPGLNAMLARCGPRRAVRVAQEPLTLHGHRLPHRARLPSSYRCLDAVVTVTEVGASTRRSRTPSVKMSVIPNCVPPPRVPQSHGSSDVAMTADRFTPGERFDRLVDAFAMVAAERSDGRLKFYENGGTYGAFQQRIDHHSLQDGVFLMGMHASMEKERADTALAAVGSSRETFGMTLAEARLCGLPVAGTNRPLGLREIVRHGQVGLLVPVDDTGVLADALLSLVTDDPRRLDMARSVPAAVADRHEALRRALGERGPDPTDASTPASHRLRSAMTALRCAIVECAFRAGRGNKHSTKNQRTS
ncbi:glycosyltransferase [Streptomyces sp. NPDC057675]|uniref:glycosyltransferase n=1 Tax=Streptomyces sp. NPDC057675 TaxID=3346204 RepID=UPI00368CADA1